jgi:hypothetical protein
MKRLEVYLIDGQHISELIKEHFDAEYHYDEDEGSLRLFDCSNIDLKSGKETARILREEDWDEPNFEDALHALVAEGILEPAHFLLEDKIGISQYDDVM